MNRAPECLLRADVVAEHEFAGALPVDVFLLNVIRAVAGDELPAKIDGVESQRNAGFRGEGMDEAGVDEEDVAGANREASAVAVHLSAALCDAEKLVFLMPVQADALAPRRV